MNMFMEAVVRDSTLVIYSDTSLMSDPANEFFG